jgi:hypothetical protein
LAQRYSFEGNALGVLNMSQKPSPDEPDQTSAARATFSRKQFLGLLGGGAGGLMLPATLSAGEPNSATDPQTNTDAGLLPLIPANERKTRISFRYFLPWAPAWGDQKLADQRLEELVRFGHASGIDSVQFFVNTLRSTYYALPVNVASQQPWIDWMRETVAPRIRAEGFGFELNFQELLGATTSGTDMRSLYRWKQFMVDNNGETSPGSPCPEDPIYRQEMAKMLRAWAGTRPDILWIDDDFRLHNHSTDGMYCYCPLHLKKFAARVGREYTREEILAAVLQPGAPSDFRRQWLDFLGDCMAEFARWISDNIHSQSPETRVALMISGTDIHSLEGRDWKKVLGNFAGKFKPLVRPTFGLYTGTTAPPKAASSSLTAILSQVQVIEQSLGENQCDFAPELENTRYTTWAKSVAHSTASLLLGQLMGLPMITAAVNDLDGSPLAEEPTTVPLFRNARPRMESLAALNLKSWPVQGLVALADKDVARKTHLAKSASYEDMAPGTRLQAALTPMGIPFHYLTAAEAAVSGEVVLLEAGTIWNASDADLGKILSGAVLLSSGGARLIAERGFGGLIGVKVKRHRTQGIQSEEYPDGLLPGVNAIRVPHRGADWDELELTDTNAKVASWFCDMLGEKHIGTALFINSQGGRVAVYAQNSDMQGGLFGSHARRRWLHGVLLWLSNGQFTALPVIPQHGVSLLKQGRGQSLYSFCNLGTDILTAFNLRWPKAETIRSIQCLKKDGRWQEVKYRVTSDTSQCPPQIQFATDLDCYAWLVLLIQQSSG